MQQRRGTQMINAMCTVSFRGTLMDHRGVWKSVCLIALDSPRSTSWPALPPHLSLEVPWSPLAVSSESVQDDVTVLVLQLLQMLGFFFLLLFPQQQQQLDRSAFTHLPSPFSAPPSNVAELSLASQIESPDSPSPLLCATEPAGAPATALRVGEGSH